MISKEDAAQLAATTLKNIIDKVAAGGIPTAREQAILDAATASQAARKYSRAQVEYAALYKVDERTVRRWMEKGLPLDDERAMAEYRSPRGRKPDVAEGFGEQVPEEGGEDLPSLVDLGDEFFRGTGVLAAIDRLKKAEQERSAAYFTALRQRANAQIIGNRFKEWTAIIEALRKLEVSAPEIRKLNGMSLPRDEVQAATSLVLQSFRTAALNLPGRAADKLDGTTSREERVEILEREIRTLLRTLTDLSFDHVDAATDLARPSHEESAGA